MSLENLPRVSIICTVYNKASWLSETLNSLLAQEKVSFELIVIDDASTDDSWEIICQFAKEFPDKIKTTRNEQNEGIARTWQKVCQMATGQYIARCDGDDYWTDNLKLHKQVQALQSNQNAKWCGTDIDFIDTEGHIIAEAVFKNRVVKQANTYELMLATRGFTAPSSWLVETDLMITVNEMLSDDPDTADDTYNLQLDLFQKTDFFYLDEVTVAYRVNQGSDSRPQRLEQQNKRFDQLLETQNLYIDKYPKADFKKALKLSLDRSNEFEKQLSQQDYRVSQINSQFLTVYFRAEEENFSQENIFQVPLSYKDKLILRVPSNTMALRIDLSEMASFYKNVSLKTLKYYTEVEPQYCSGYTVGNYELFVEDDPQLIYDISTVEIKEFELSYEMLNVDRADKADYIARVLSRELNAKKDLGKERDYWQSQYQESCRRELRYKSELEEMVVRYNSVTHSRRWTIPTAIINFFRRKK